MNKFDDGNLLSANKELQDLLEVAHFLPAERKAFIDKIKKELSLKGITLDSLI